MGARTLRQLAGAPTSPPSLGEAALVLIDAQDEYVTGALPLDGVKPALERAGALLGAARKAGTPIFHVVHRGAPGGPFDPAGAGYAIAPQVAPRPGERTIEKTLPNSFAKTELLAALQHSGRRKLIVAGFMTHMCVSATVRAALELDFQSTVIADACATRALPDQLGGADLAAADIHRAALAALGDRFAIIARTDDLVG